MHKTIAIVALRVIAAVLWVDVPSPTLSAAQLSVAQKDTDGPQPACPDPDKPNVSYVSSDPSACARIRFTCAPGETLFSNSCGCGCIAPNIKGNSHCSVHGIGDTLSAAGQPHLDPIGVMVAVLAFEVILTGEMQHATSAVITVLVMAVFPRRFSPSLMPC